MEIYNIKCKICDKGFYEEETITLDDEDKLIHAKCKKDGK